MMYKSYSELIKLDTIEERFNYLKLSGYVGDVTFGGHRYLNQHFYKTDPDWLMARKEVILRDNGCDLAHEDYPITGKIYIHHVNPITIDDVLKRRPCLYDLENLISVSFQTHNAIHYGDSKQLPIMPVERNKNDTCPWR